MFYGRIIIEKVRTTLWIPKIKTEWIGEIVPVFYKTPRYEGKQWSGGTAACILRLVIRWW